MLKGLNQDRKWKSRFIIKENILKFLINIKKLRKKLLFAFFSDTIIFCPREMFKFRLD
jgi:hypothetical protein